MNFVKLTFLSQISSLMHDVKMASLNIFGLSTFNNRIFIFSLEIELFGKMIGNFKKIKNLISGESLNVTIRVDGDIFPSANFSDR